VAGGEATLDALARVDHDVLAHRCRPRKSRVMVRAIPLLAGRAPEAAA